MAAEGDTHPRIPAQRKVLALNLATAVVLLALATVHPGWRPWVALVAAIAVIGELIRWRRARRAGEENWEPLQPSTES